MLKSLSSTVKIGLRVIAIVLFIVYSDGATSTDIVTLLVTFASLQWILQIVDIVLDEFDKEDDK